MRNVETKTLVYRLRSSMSLFGLSSGVPSSIPAWLAPKSLDKENGLAYMHEKEWLIHWLCPKTTLCWRWTFAIIGRSQVRSLLVSTHPLLSKGEITRRNSVPINLITQILFQDSIFYRHSGQDRLTGKSWFLPTRLLCEPNHSRLDDEVMVGSGKINNRKSGRWRGWSLFIF